MSRITTYTKFPQFITTDPRINRSGQAYKVDEFFMQDRHDCFFYNYDLTGKTVLDIGCCVGATGAYVLDKGAKFYHGIEYDDILSNQAANNFLNSFDQDQWKIDNDSIENFSKNNNTYYDVVVLSGVIYALFDCIPVLTTLCKNTNTVIIDGMHPDFLKNIPTDVVNILNQYNLWQGFIENASFIEHNDTYMFMHKSIKYNGSKQSFGFIKNFLYMIGFKNANVVNELLKNKIPYHYNSHNRYGERFERITNQTQGLGYVGI